MFRKTLKLFAKKNENKQIVKTMVDDFFLIQKKKDIRAAIKNKNLKASTKILHEIKSRNLDVSRNIYDKIFELSSNLRQLNFGKNLFRKEKLDYSKNEEKLK
jgi:hypothetical protein